MQEPHEEPNDGLDVARLHDLISRAGDGIGDDAEGAELVTLLSLHAQARQIWFLRNDIDLGLDAFAAAGHPESPSSEPRGHAAHPTAKAGAPRWAAAVLLAATLGAVAGAFGFSAVLAIASPWRTTAPEIVEVLSESFEQTVAATVPGLPRGASDAAGTTWHGDEARVVTAMQGVEPPKGIRMLKFERSTYAGEGAVKNSAWSDVYKLVDVEPFFAFTAGGAATARLSATFLTAVSSPTSGESYSASLRICALDRDVFTEAGGPLTLVTILDKCIALGARKVPLESSAGGSQPVSVDVTIPPSTRYLLVHVAVVRDAPRPALEPVQFPGHFLDDVRLDLITRPHERGNRL